jgi:ATP-dependent 26S proteasome regulatory subunit
MNDKERQAFDKAISTIKAQQRQLEDLASPVYPIGTIVGVLEKSLILDLNNGVFEAERPAGTDSSWLGAVVKIHPKTGQVVTTSKYIRYGQTASVQQIIGNVIVLNLLDRSFATEASQVPAAELAVGDSVLLDFTNKVVLRKVESKSKYGYKTQSPLAWTDVGGCSEAKAELRKELELPYSHADVFKFFNKKRVKGGLLWGRPGNGKTLLGRCCAGAIARAHGKEGADTGFLYVKGPELLSKWVGDTESGVRSLFDHSRLHYKEHGYPAVIFIDEADALLIRRGMRTTSGMEQTVVPMFNAEMDGMEESGAFVLLATNRADILDPAITRPGRCDRKFYIAPPTKESAVEIFSIHMRNVPIAASGSKEQLIECANNAFFSDQFPLYKLETDKGIKVFSLAQLASGANIAG